MESVWKDAFQYVHDPNGLWEYLASLPHKIRTEFVHKLLISKSCQLTAQKNVREKFKQEHGSSRGWDYLKEHPESMERKKQYMREYYLRRKQQSTIGINEHR
jgi:hypothetical protein